MRLDVGYTNINFAARTDRWYATSATIDCLKLKRPIKMQLLDAVIRSNPGIYTVQPSESSQAEARGANDPKPCLTKD